MNNNDYVLKIIDNNEYNDAKKKIIALKNVIKDNHKPFLNKYLIEFIQYKILYHMIYEILNDTTITDEIKADEIIKKYYEIRHAEIYDSEYKYHTSSNDISFKTEAYIAVMSIIHDINTIIEKYENIKNLIQNAENIYTKKNIIQNAENIDTKKNLIQNAENIDTEKNLIQNAKNIYTELNNFLIKNYNTIDKKTYQTFFNYFNQFKYTIKYIKDQKLYTNIDKEQSYITNIKKVLNELRTMNIKLINDHNQDAIDLNQDAIDLNQDAIDPNQAAMKNKLIEMKNKLIEIIHEINIIINNMENYYEDIYKLIIDIETKLIVIKENEYDSVDHIGIFLDIIKEKLDECKNYNLKNLLKNDEFNDIKTTINKYKKKFILPPKDIINNLDEATKKLTSNRKNNKVIKNIAKIQTDKVIENIAKIQTDIKRYTKKKKLYKNRKTVNNNILYKDRLIKTVKNNIEKILQQNYDKMKSIHKIIKLFTKQNIIDIDLIINAVETKPKFIDDYFEFYTFYKNNNKIPTIRYNDIMYLFYFLNIMYTRLYENQNENIIDFNYIHKQIENDLNNDINTKKSESPSENNTKKSKSPITSVNKSKKSESQITPVNKTKKSKPTSR